MSETIVLDLVGRIYEAAEDPRLWNPVLEKLADAVGAGPTGLVYEDLAHNRASLAALVRADPFFQRQYEDYYAARNPWTAAAAARPSVGPGAVLAGEMLLPDAQLVKTEYYTDFLRKVGVRHLLATFLLRDETKIAHLSLLRSPKRGEFGPREFTILENVAPHVRRALELHRRINVLEEDHSGVLEGLDRAPFGVMLLDGNGRVRLCNRVAREILASNDGLTLRGSELVAADAGDTAALQKAIRSALDVTRGKVARAGGALRIERPSLRRPLSLFVSPLSRRCGPFDGAGAAAVVFITDPERKADADVELLQGHYGMTPTEARLAARLAEGCAVKEAARALKMSVNTARSHVKHIHVKTETSSPGELVRLLLATAGSLRKEAE